MKRRFCHDGPPQSQPSPAPLPGFEPSPEHQAATQEGHKFAQPFFGFAQSGFHMLDVVPVKALESITLQMAQNPFARLATPSALHLGCRRVRPRRA